MQDIDFDELDRAVNSVSTADVPVSESVPVAVNSGTHAAEVHAPTTSPSSTPAVRPTTGRFMDVVHPSSAMRGAQTAQGFTQVVLAGRSGDRGVDVMAIDPAGKRTIVQCKQWLTNNVGSTPIQRLDSFARTRNAQRKILVTTSDFTPQGVDEANLTKTEMINNQDLKKLIAQHMPEFISEN